VALTVFTSRWWQEAYQAGWNVPRSTARGGLLTTVVVYIQIVLGAVLRHIPVWASPGFFRIAVFFHLVFAAVVVGYLVFLAMRVRRVPQGTSGLRWPIWGMVLLVVVQLTLGCATYVVNYWWPGWAADLGLATIRYTIVEASGRLQSLTMTAHVATGSLLLGLAMLFLVRAQRVCARAVAIPRAREHRVRPRGALA
jgi:cytochrome c oxidase assembly protein subunit 15